MLTEMVRRVVELELTVPIPGMAVKTVRPLYSDNGLGGHELPPGLLGRVSEVLDEDDPSKTCISITFDKLQPGAILTERLQEWAAEYNDDSLIYTFHPNTGWELNQIKCAGLLEFHLYCDVIDD